MKRFFLGLLALALALGLAACAHNAPAEGGGPAGGSAAPAAGNDGALRLLGPDTPEGRYTVGHQDGTYSGDGILTYIDYEGLQQVALCADPNCDHTGEGCTARGPAGSAYLYGAWVVDENTLVVAAHRDAGGNGLWRCRADGTDPVVLECSDPLLPAYPLLFDGTYLYYESYGDTDSGKDALVLYRTPLSGGSNEKVLALPDSAQRILGCQGREVLLYREDYSARNAIPVPQPDENTSTEAHDAAWEGFYAQLAATPVGYGLVYKNIDTGEDRTLCAWEKTGDFFPETPVCLGGHILLTDCEAAALRDVLPDGTVREWALPAPPECADFNAHISAVPGDVAVVDVNYNIVPGPEQTAELVRKRYAVDLAGGECRELTLSYMNDGLQPLCIVSFTDDALIVEFERQSSQDVYYDYTSRCGLLSAEDFLNDRPNYRELSTPYGPLATDGKTN